MYTIHDTQRGHTAHMEARVRELKVPFIRDGLVLGKNARVGSFAVQKALHLLMDSTFAQLELEDDVVGDILIRKDLLLRIDQLDLVRFIHERIKPMMCGEEILELDLSIEIGITH